MKRFRETAAGRTLALAVALPLATGALATFTQEGSGIVWIIASVFAGILLGIVGVGLAVEEHVDAAVTAVMFLPPALLLYTPLVAFWGTVPAVKMLMTLGAIFFFASALGQASFRPRLASSPRMTTRSA
jgi:hypothetical protein